MDFTKSKGRGGGGDKKESTHFNNYIHQQIDIIKEREITLLSDNNRA